MPTDRIIADVKVGVRIDHPRVSDLALHLTSPQGSRILLAENRGGITSRPISAQGSGRLAITYAGFTENTNLAVGLIKFVSPPYVHKHHGETNLVGGFEGIPARAYTAGSNGGRLGCANQSGDGGHERPRADTGTNVLIWNRPISVALLPTTAGKHIRFKFRLSSKGPGPSMSKFIWMASWCGSSRDRPPSGR